MSDVLRYIPSPTGLEFHQDHNHYFRFVKGPVGSGKTSMAIMETWFASIRQAPDKSGRRKTRWLVVRKTYPELKSTVIKSFQSWLGSMLTVVYDIPIRGKIEQTLPDGTILDVEYVFIALDDEKAVAKLRSLEVTAAYISEASEIDYPVVEMIRTRIGRYPAVREDEHGKRIDGPTWRGIIAESNPPPLRSWIYNMFEVTRPANWKIYHQPAGLLYDAESDTYAPNPTAENIKYLEGGYQYYFDQVAGGRTEFIRVYVLGEYGMSFDGKPVWPMFTSSTHVHTSRIMPLPNVQVVVGMDYGLMPAAVFSQMGPMGQVSVMDALAPQDLTLEEFIVEHMLPLIQERYAQNRILIIGDPAGAARSALARANSFEVLRSFGLPVRPAVSNDPQLRNDAVAYFLNRPGGFIADPHCVDLIEAMAGGYRFKKRNSSDLDAGYKDKPEKNRHSHISDALAYQCLYFRTPALSAGSGQRTIAPPKKFLWA